MVDSKIKKLLNIIFHNSKYLSGEITLLAIASAGGHWVELRRLRPAWKGCKVTYVSTSANRKEELIKEAKKNQMDIPQYYTVIEASRWEKAKLLRQFVQIFIIILRTRPQVIISTGAAPGFFALKIGKLLGAQTIWVDSIANARELSLSGEKVASSADLWLTQWEHLVEKDIKKMQLRYEGKII